MKKLIIILMILSSQKLIAQDTTFVFGDFREYFEMEENENPKLNGTYMFYNDKKVLMYMRSFVQGKRQGRFTTFDYQTGFLQRIEFYESGMRAGSWSVYSDENLLAEVSTYTKGILISKLVFHKKGMLKHSFYYSGSPANFLKYSFWESGNIKSMEAYKNGQLDGIMRSYYPNGMAEKEYYIKSLNAIKPDSIQYYYEDEIVKYSDCIEVVASSVPKPIKKWKPDGTALFLYNYEEGHGVLSYFRNGIRIGQQWYENNVLVKEEGEIPR